MHGANSHLLRGNFMRSPSLLFSGLGSIALAATLAVTPAQAQTTLFVPCSGTNGGPDGLIAAINTVQTGSGLIQLAPGCTYTFTTPAVAGSALPIITGRVAITGDNATIARAHNAADEFRIATVRASGFLSLNGVTIKGGVSSDGGGGILNAGTVSLKHSSLTENADFGANGGGGLLAMGSSLTLLHHSMISGNTALAGGGARVLGTLRAVESNFTGNTTTGQGGGLLLDGGAARLLDSVVSRNRAFSGAGIYQTSGNLQINHTRIFGNEAARNGGGLFVSSGTVRIAKGEIVRNVANGTGGGIFNDANINLKGTTVAGNTPNNCAGGSIIPGCTNGTIAPNRDR